MTAVGTARGAGLAFGRVVRAEQLKFRSLRATTVTLVAGGVLVVLLGCLVAAAQTGEISAPRQGPALGDLDPVTASLNGVNFAVLIVGVLGVLVSAREYATGLIRVTLQAVPSRLPVLWAKALVLGGLVLAVMSVATTAAFLGGQAVLRAGGADSASLADDGVLRAVLGSAVYLTCIALLGLALGFLLRSTAGAVGTLVGGLLVLPTIAAALLPDDWTGLLAYLPSNAGTASTAVIQDPDLLSPGQGFAVLVAWMVVALASAAVALVRRDA